MNSRVIALSVKSLEQQTKSVSLPYNSTVLELKQKIKVVFDIDGDRQRLLFRGKVLRDDKKLLDYGTYCSKIVLVYTYLFNVSI